MRLNVCETLAKLGDDPTVWKPACEVLVKDRYAIVAIRAAGLLAQYTRDSSGWPVVKAALMSKDVTSTNEAAGVASHFDGLPIKDGGLIDVLATVKEVFGTLETPVQAAMLPAIYGCAKPANREAIKGLESQAGSNYVRDTIVAAVKSADASKGNTTPTEPAESRSQKR